MSENTLLILFQCIYIFIINKFLTFFLLTVCIVDVKTSYFSLVLVEMTRKFTSARQSYHVNPNLGIENDIRDPYWH